MSMPDEAASEGDALQNTDVLEVLLDSVGVLLLAPAAATCRAWSVAAASVRRQWRVLQPVGLLDMAVLDRTYRVPVGCNFLAALPDGGLCISTAAVQRHYSGAATQTALVTLSAAALSSAAANLVTPAKTNLTTNLVTPGQSLPRLTTFVAGHSDRTGHDPNSGLKSQRGVCVDGDGDGVFVCDTGRDRVLKFELSTGRLLASSDDAPPGRGARLIFPSGCAHHRRLTKGARTLAQDAPKQLSVVDRMNHRVVQLDPDTLYPQTMCGAPGDGAGELDRPSDVAAVGTSLFVTDLGNDRVCCFELQPPPHGPVFRFAFGSAGVAYATEGSNPGLAGRVPGRPCSATHTFEPRLGQPGG